MLTRWLDAVLEEPARMAGMTTERMAIQVGAGALASVTNILFEEFTTSLLNTIGKALIGVGLTATAAEILPVRLMELDDRTKQEILVVGSVIGLDGIYRAVRNLSATQTALQQFLSALQSGNILGALQMLVKNPFTQPAAGTGAAVVTAAATTTAPVTVVRSITPEEEIVPIAEAAPESGYTDVSVL